VVKAAMPAMSAEVSCDWPECLREIDILRLISHDSIWRATAMRKRVIPNGVRDLA
jgi:hypothetical protein